MNKNDAQAKGTKWLLGTCLVAAVAVATIVILVVSESLLFPQEYSAPDYNHFLSNALMCLIALIGIGAMAVLCYIKSYRNILSILLALGATVWILYSVFNTMSTNTYYYYDAKYHWSTRNSFGLECTYPVGYKYEESFIFGNTLLLQYDSTKISSRDNEATIYQDPIIYNKDLQKMTKPFVLTDVDDLPRLVAYFCEDTTKNEYGVMDGDWNVIVKPGQYQDVNLHKFRHHIPVMQNGKWGLVNLKGELVVDCMFDKMYGFMSNDYFPGGYLVAYQGDDAFVLGDNDRTGNGNLYRFLERNLDFVMVDTIGNVISYEEYHSMYPNIILK